MNFSWSKVFFYAMIVLGIIGLISLLNSNPILLLTRILVGAAVIGIIIFVYRVVTGQNKSQDAGYKRAVRQTKKRKREKKREHASRPGHLQVIPSRSLLKKKPSDKRGENHLTVIDGKKKRKGNSSFSR
ncbi:MAG TPA: SA1362 family protein [Sporolactobacillaceae bacterium]|nr:SA1362 family protein [Sporolactobacillaceae bacterium]